MEEELKRNIKLRIYDTFISVRVPQDDEPLYRKDADLINELLNLYYAMIDLGLRLQKELRRNDSEPYEKVMKELTGEMEKLLEEK